MRPAGDRGALSIEYVIITPMIFLVLALIYAFGRVADVNGNLDASTRDAARVATKAPDYAQASQSANDIVRASVHSASCLRSLRVDVLPSGQNAFTPGQTLTVRSTCTYSISDIGLPGAPGDVTVTSQFSSVIDPNRTLG